VATPTRAASPSTSATARATGSPTPSETAPTGGTTYTVQPGDTLFSIAARFGTTVAAIQELNADRYPALVTQPERLESGWTLVVSAHAAATPRRTAAATPAPPSGGGNVCSAGRRVASGSPETFRTIPDAGAAVALTFDMGGRMDPAVDIMNFLVANRVCATIFATGVMSETAHGREVMAIIRAHPELFEIANHTMYHCDLVRGGGGSPTTAPCETGGTPSAAFVREELMDAHAVLSAGTGQDPRPYWRPPYGSVNQAVIDAAAAAGYTKTFMWDIDTIDWKPVSDGGPTAEQIASKVVSRAVNGSNVLFHLGGYETLDALELIVPGLRDRGFSLTSLSDLLD
jgi:peptidoglycan/xylan/chitin deacetylase (PgdA/CDA1 family)